jgi:GDP-L-fucose synthase
MHVDDCADALVFLMERYSAPEHINVGSGEEITVADLARLVAGIAGYEGAIVTDPSKPDGTPRKLIDSSKLASLGWTRTIGLRDGIAATYRWYAATRNA